MMTVIQLLFYDEGEAALPFLGGARKESVREEPPVMGYAISQNPDWKLEFTPFADNNPDFPMLTGKGRQFVLGLNKDNKKLLDDMNAVLTELWSSCKLKEIGAKYGMSDSVWCQPGADNQRAGVDRPSHWKQPHCQ